MKETLKAARQKYLLLGREIEKLPHGHERDNCQHTHSKLGIFLGEALGPAWRESDAVSSNEGDGR